MKSLKKIAYKTLIVAATLLPYQSIVSNVDSNSEKMSRLEIALEDAPLESASNNYYMSPSERETTLEVAYSIQKDKERELKRVDKIKKKLDGKYYMFICEDWVDSNNDGEPQYIEFKNIRSINDAYFPEGSSPVLVFKTVNKNTTLEVKKIKDKSFPPFSFEEKNTKGKVVKIQLGSLTDGFYVAKFRQLRFGIEVSKK